MSWQMYIALSVVLYSISVLLQRVLVKDNSRSVAFSVIFQIVTGIMLALIGFAVSDMTIPDLRPLVWNLIVMAVLYGLGNVSIFRSLKDTEASVFTILFSTRALFTITASSLLLHEVLSGRQLLGAGFIFAAVVLVNWRSKRIKFGTGELLAIGAAICFGLANTNDRYLLQSFPFYPFLTIAFIVPAGLVAALYPREMKYIPMFLKGAALPRLLLLCVFYALSAITFYAALQTGDNSSQVAAVNLTSVIVIVLLSVIFLKEREHTSRKIIGAVLSFIGLLLLS